MEKLDATAYLAAPGFEPQLLAELKAVLQVHGRLVLAQGPCQEAHWAQNVWLSPQRLKIRSVSDGAAQLRSIQRNWALYSAKLHRRAHLIQDHLPHVSAKPLEFPSLPPSAPLGSWTLLQEDTVLASAECSSPFPNGEAGFLGVSSRGEARGEARLKVGPPNRAYLKLWEALTLLGRWPKPEERCLDAGCAPGGWTWALARLGAQVLAVDRAPLAPNLGKMRGVEYQRRSAFSIAPRREGVFDWIFCDVVCYPERLWKWIRAWLESGACRNFVCTVKFQGDSHYGVIRELSSVPGSSLVHLWNNKHELTWMFPT